MKTKYLIFDFDGVLARSLDDCIKYNLRFGLYPNKTFDEIKQIVQNKYLEPKHSKKNNPTELEVQKIIEFNQELGRKIITCQNTIFTDFIDQIKLISNAKLAIVSSGSSIYISHLLKQIPLSFDYILTIEDSPFKDDKIGIVAKSWGIELDQCYYFTDTCSDVLELKDTITDDKIIGCVWGWSGIESLSKILPADNILNNFNDIHKLF